MSTAEFADPPLTEHSAYVLSQLGRASRGEVARALAARSLTLRDTSALAVLVESGPISQADLGRRLKLDPSDITALIDDLADHGRVERTVDPTDRRRRLIRATRSGKSALNFALRAIRKVDEELLTPVPQASRQALHDALVAMLIHQRSRPSQLPSA